MRSLQLSLANSGLTRVRGPIQQIEQWLSDCPSEFAGNRVPDLPRDVNPRADKNVVVRK
jgi:hypothetical protein